MSFEYNDDFRLQQALTWKFSSLDRSSCVRRSKRGA